MGALVDPLYVEWWGKECANQSPGGERHILRFHYRCGSIRQIDRVWCWDCGWEVRA